MLHVLTAVLFCLIFGLQTRTTDAKKGFGPGEQDWGYIKIRESSQMFWWLFYVNPQNRSNSLNVYEKPLLIWLQGGPGSSGSGYGNFVEIGPLDVDLNPRNFSWVNYYNILFIDNPIGTGFSYEESEQIAELSDEIITQDLIEFMKSFITLKPQFLKTPIYVVGESYGGKMAANFVWQWWQYQQQNTVTKINLEGIVLCSPWISSADSVRALPAYLLNLGQIDTTEYNEIEELTKSVIYALDENDWSNAYYFWYQLIERSTTVINHNNLYNILEKTAPIAETRHYFTNYYETSTLDTTITVDPTPKLERLMNEEVKKTLNLEKFNNTWQAQALNVYHKLKNDIMKPAILTVDRILDQTNLKVFVLAGQLDFIAPITGTLRWVENLKWNFIEHWKNATKISFTVDNVLEGYVKEYDKLKFFWIYRAGHELPKNNPRAMIAVLKDLTG